MSKNERAVALVTEGASNGERDDRAQEFEWDSSDRGQECAFAGQALSESFLLGAQIFEKGLSARDGFGEGGDRRKVGVTCAMDIFSLRGGREYVQSNGVQRDRQRVAREGCAALGTEFGGDGGRFEAWEFHIRTAMDIVDKKSEPILRSHLQNR